MTSSNVYKVKEMCSRWYRSQFKKFKKAWVRVEILCLDFRKTASNQNTKSSKVATFENCEIFSNYYFSYVRDYKATLAGDNKSLENKLLREELLYELSNAALEENADGFEEFIELCHKTPNHHAPAKQKFVRGSHLLFMNKTLLKAIMHRTRFRNKYLKNKPTKTKEII